ncbi:hypothetical protein JD844_005072 [Phrynosoma platyrhinos]|uniref:Suppressor APC domain-containing protein n=1 Tax=Phrynosoma platyrhinos TaxID=52577 RepID=A0ABQ7SE60_PHRPL|nr:hypothetical protein JD844_005072 [Phrynosoma platyrhinos]
MRPPSPPSPPSPLPLPPGPEGPPASAALPAAFLRSLRTLFDILDDRRRGFVPLREIESRWLEAEEAPLALRGVLEGLRGAAAPDGRLTFERFLLGLRASLLLQGQGQGQGQGKPKKEEEEERAAAAGPAPLGGSPPHVPSLLFSSPVPSPATAEETCGMRSLAGPLQNGTSSKGATEARRRQARSRGEQRRHTITGGVDYGRLKRMKEMEKEKDFLLQGLEMVEQVRDWYHHQIHRIQEQQRHLAQSKAHKEVLAEGSQSYLHHLLPKLQELNRCLRELLSFSTKPLSPCPVATNGPASIATTSPPLAGPQQTINMLKEQNWLLTKEVTDKSDRITQLEQEKSALIKQLFEARAQSNRDANLLDSTFI